MLLLGKFLHPEFVEKYGEELNYTGCKLNDSAEGPGIAYLNSDFLTMVYSSNWTLGILNGTGNMIFLMTGNFWQVLQSSDRSDNLKQFLPSLDK